MNHPRRVDNNHAKIRTELRKKGAFVADLSQCGRGIPDLLVAVGEVVTLLEVKSPGEKLTPQEREFFEHYPGRLYQVERVKDALDVVFDSQESKIGHSSQF